MHLCCGYSFKILRVCILRRIDIKHIIHDHKARLAATPAVPESVIIYQRLRGASPALAVPFFIGASGIARPRQKDTVAIALLGDDHGGGISDVIVTLVIKYIRIAYGQSIPGVGSGA